MQRSIFQLIVLPYWSTRPLVPQQWSRALSSGRATGRSEHRQEQEERGYASKSVRILEHLKLRHGDNSDPFDLDQPGPSTLDWSGEGRRADSSRSLEEEPVKQRGRLSSNSARTPDRKAQRSPEGPDADSRSTARRPLRPVGPWMGRWKRPRRLVSRRFKSSHPPKPPDRASEQSRRTKTILDAANTILNLHSHEYNVDSASTPEPPELVLAVLRKDQTSNLLPRRKDKEDREALEGPILPPYLPKQQAEEVYDQASTTSEQIAATAQSLSYGAALPPLIHRLLARRQFRLAIFTIINDSTYFTDAKMVNDVIRMLENGGAGKQAKKLRQGVADAAKAAGYLVVPENESESPEQESRGPKGARRSQEDKIRLSGDYRKVKQEDGTLAKTPRGPQHWRLPRLPADFAEISSHPDLTKAQSMTIYFNHQLTYLLERNKYVISPSTLEPTLTPGSYHFPRSAPNLLQLSKLLEMIEFLKKKFGFKPNRITANIIVRCWIQCGLGHNNHSRHRTATPHYAVAERSSGETLLGMKDEMDSPFLFGGRELKLVFEVVSRLMDDAIARVDVNLDKQDWEIEWRKHVVPFCETVKTSLRRVRADKALIKQVLDWEKTQKYRLQTIERLRVQRQYETGKRSIEPAKEGGGLEKTARAQDDRRRQWAIEGLKTCGQDRTLYQ